MRKQGVVLKKHTHIAFIGGNMVHLPAVDQD